MLGKYGAYTIDLSLNGADAVAIREFNGTMQEIKLYRTEHALYEGVYGDVEIGTVAICGCCLMIKGNWVVEFYPIQKSDPPARRSPFVGSERTKILERLDPEKEKNPQKRIVTKMEMPKSPEVCYRTLIAWQAFVARRQGIKTIYYHIPALEYHRHIEVIERALGKKIPAVHAHLDAYAALMRTLVLEAFEGIDVHLLEPFHCAGGDPLYSYILPYHRPDIFDIPTKGLIGIEDITEVRLSCEAVSKGAPSIPIVGCVVALPDPFYVGREEENSIVFEL